MFERLSPGSQGQILALNVLSVGSMEGVGKRESSLLTTYLSEST
jgi:hypothetical protein